MTYLDFIKTIPIQEDQEINDFCDLVKQDNIFPNSSDPIILAKYLYQKLDEKATYAFQQTFILYSYMPDNKIPGEYKNNQPKLLEAINYIINLQNNNS